MRSGGRRGRLLARRLGSCVSVDPGVISGVSNTCSHSDALHARDRLVTKVMRSWNQCLLLGAFDDQRPAAAERDGESSFSLYCLMTFRTDLAPRSYRFSQTNKLSTFNALKRYGGALRCNNFACHLLDAWHFREAYVSPPALCRQANLCAEAPSALVYSQFILVQPARGGGGRDDTRRTAQHV